MAIDYLQGTATALVDLEKSFPAGNESKDNSLISSLDDFRVQTKSMYVWWMLRDMVGANALDAALHNYKAADDSDPKYMQKLIEAQSHIVICSGSSMIGFITTGVARVSCGVGLS